MKLESIPLSELRESRANPRIRFDAAALAELADSIKQVGVLEPLTVRQKNGHFEIASGARRFRASKIAGVETVPAIVREMTDVELLEVLVIANNQREDVHPLEEMQGYRALLKAGHSVETIAQRISRTKKYVYDRLKLEDLGKEAKKLFLEGAFPFSIARLLSQIPEADQARALMVPKNDWGATGAVFVRENVEELDFDERKSPSLKPASAREVAAWIQENVRLDPAQKDLPQLFPRAAAAIAESAEKEEKVVLITREHQLPAGTKTDQRVLTARAWKRADGGPDETPGSRKKSKTCEVSVVGVVVIGPGRGESFRVCADTDCETHWGAEQRAEAKAAKQSKGADAYEAYNKKQQAEFERQRAAGARWTKATPAILEAVAARVKVMPAKATGALGQIVVRAVLGYGATAAGALVPPGRTAEDLVRHAAFLVLRREIQDSFNGPQQFPRRAKALGVDVAKILKEHAPAPDVKKAKKKASKS